jgi:uncharacterized protein YlxW (UPF0749 family)
MPPEVLEMIAPLIAIIGVGTMVLIGMKMRLSAKVQLQQGSKKEDVERLADAVDALHDEVRMLREEHAELQERMDFAERMLSSGKSRKALGEQTSTPT